MESTTVHTDVDPRIERSRRLVLDAAITELAERGYGELTIDGIARRSGVARSTIYRHWSDKLAIVSEAFEALNRQPPETAASTGRRHVYEIVRHLADVMEQSSFSDCMPALIEAAERHSEVRETLSAYSDRRRQALADAIADAVDRGEVRADVDPDLAALAIAGAIIYRRVTGGPRFDPRRSRRLVDTVLGPRPGKSDAGRR